MERAEPEERVAAEPPARVELRFEPKSPEAVAAARTELNSARTGRKARRYEQAKTPATLTQQQFDLVETLTALRNGPAPPGASE